MLGVGGVGGGGSVISLQVVIFYIITVFYGIPTMTKISTVERGFSNQHLMFKCGQTHNTKFGHQFYTVGQRSKSTKTTIPKAVNIIDSKVSRLIPRIDSIIGKENLHNRVQAVV